MTPTQRSLAKLRNEGFSACVVEKWIPHIRQRKDAFGFGDILACKPSYIGCGSVLLVQTTTRANATARMNKICATAEAGIWLASGGRIVVHGWQKTKGRWVCFEWLMHEGKWFRIE